MSKPSYLILGGCGFLGRNIVEYLVNNDLSDHIAVVDKARPELSWMSTRHKTAFADPRVNYKQCNLCNQENTQLVFDRHNYDFVINCARESRYGMTKEVYEESITKLGINCAKIAATKGVKKFVQVSTAELYTNSKDKKTESSKIDAVSPQAIAVKKLEAELLTMNGLNYAIVRCALVYGSGDRYILLPRMIVASVYYLLKEPMKLLYTKNLLMNTVHVNDVVRALIFLCDHGDNGCIYNLADSSNTTQGSLTKILSEIFNIKYEFANKVESKMASTMLKGIVSDLNEKHMSPWSDACVAENIVSTPLSPYLEKQHLKKIHLSVDGSAITKLGFTYNYPDLTKDSIKQVIDDYVTDGVFPKSGLP